MRRWTWIAVVALAMAAPAWAVQNRPVMMDDASGDSRVYQAWYLPSVWQQTLGSGNPTAAEYAPAGTTDGPRLSSVQFSASATQAIHFSVFFPQNLYTPSGINVKLYYDASVGAAAQSTVVWKLNGWRVADDDVLSSLSTTPTFTATWTTDVPATARTFCVDEKENVIGDSHWTFTPDTDDMYVFRLSREYAYTADSCTSVINLHGVIVKVRTTNVQKSIGW